VVEKLLYSHRVCGYGVVETELSSGQVFPKRSWNPKKTTVISFFIEEKKE
jgi:hypothetical protein